MNRLLAVFALTALPAFAQSGFFRPQARVEDRGHATAPTVRDGPAPCSLHAQFWARLQPDVEVDMGGSVAQACLATMERATFYAMKNAAAKVAVGGEPSIPTPYTCHIDIAWDATAPFAPAVKVPPELQQSCNPCLPGALQAVHAMIAAS